MDKKEISSWPICLADVGRVFRETTGISAVVKIKEEA